MTEFTPYTAIAGGLLIGLGTVILMVFNGNVAGISGIVSRSISSLKRRDPWRMFFIVGLIVGCYLSFTFLDVDPPKAPPTSDTLTIIAGFLVGLGTVIGSGCTSGHGVCGIGRLSKRSLIATCVFLLTGIATATVMEFSL